MKLAFAKILLVFVTILVLTPKDVLAQDRKKPAAPTQISAADQKAIKALFKDLDSTTYRLQFNNAKEVVGKRAVKMEDLEQVRKITNPAEAAGYIVFVVEGKDVIYVLAVGSSKLTSVLGKEKVAQLNKIMAKYSR